MATTNAIVLGAGVVGLTTALLLQQKHFNVTIVAKGTPDIKFYDSDPCYVSREAGAHWCSFASETDFKMQSLEAVTLKTFYQLSKYPETGVKKMRNSCLYKKKPQSSEKAPWFAEVVVENFTFIDGEELPDGYDFGYSYTTVTINVPKYLRWLLEQFRINGGKVVVKSVNHIDELLTNDVDLLVNCTGYGARSLGGVSDASVYACRGQTILVKLGPNEVQQFETLTRQGDNEDGSAAYIIPRDDGTAVLGGTFEVYNANLQPHPETAKMILQRCCSMSPVLDRSVKNGTLKILRHGVGLRPYRVGGVRVEREKRGSAIVIHNYGHGGWGYQTSWGCAEAVCGLVNKSSSKLYLPALSSCFSWRNSCWIRMISFNGSIIFGIMFTSSVIAFTARLSQLQSTFVELANDCVHIPIASAVERQCSFGSFFSFNWAYSPISFGATRILQVLYPDNSKNVSHYLWNVSK